MRPAAGTRLFFVGSDGVLFSAPRQELHAFNTTACVIWCHLEDGLTPSRIARSLALDSGIARATARAHVEAALADWTAKGLLAGVSPVPLASPRRDPAPDLPPPPRAGFAEARDYRILGVAVRIRFTRASDARRVDPLFAHLANVGPEPPVIVADIVPIGDRIAGYLDGAPAAVCPRDDAVAPMVKAMVWTAVLRRQDFLLHVHAGVVGGPAGCVLLPAAAGSGKSTLTTALVHAGLDLFSDEVALLAADLTVSPFPMAICVKQTGIDIVAAMDPRVRTLPMHQRADGKRVVYLPPRAGRVPPDGQRRAVRGIVFPRYRPGAELTARWLGPAEALARLLSHCPNVGRDLDHATVERLVRWIGPMPCAEIEYGSLEPACDFVDNLVRGAPDRSGIVPVPRGGGRASVRNICLAVDDRSKLEGIDHP